MADSLNWRKSSYSGANNAECVEVAAAADGAHGAHVLVRDTRDRAGGTLALRPGPVARVPGRAAHRRIPVVTWRLSVWATSAQRHRLRWAEVGGAAPPREG